MQKLKTHFEQIPLELVKKIAKSELPAGNLDGNDSAVPPIPVGIVKPHRAPSPRKKRRSL
jgi:hypothetical protein